MGWEALVVLDNCASIKGNVVEGVSRPQPPACSRAPVTRDLDLEAWRLEAWDLRNLGDLRRLNKLMFLAGWTAMFG